MTSMQEAASAASEDPFAVLTMPSSPSSRNAVFPVPERTPPVQIARSKRGSSKEPSPLPSSESGSFVLVSTVEDPLSTSAFVGSLSEAGDASAPAVQFPGKLEELRAEAKQRAERNERRVLDDLRAHDDDPVAWLGMKESEKSSKEGEKADPENPIASALREAESTPIDLLAPSSESVPSTPVPTSQPPPLPRTTSDTSLSHARSRSPSTPTSPSFGTSRSWMSSLLSSSRAVPASPSSPSILGSHERSLDASPKTGRDANAGGAGLSPTQSSLHALFARAHPQPARHRRHATEGHSTLHAATMPLPSLAVAESALSTAAPSPFAAHPFIVPSGAPGFAGDRNWNTAGFEFDPGKGGMGGGRAVTLLGRKEPTTPVLDGVLANSLRPHLPALARLPHCWTLLYSANQHGLSLKTLYARCAPPVVVGGGGKLPGATPTGALLAVQDADGGVFGAWVGEGVHLSHGSYYGAGDSFLWRVDPHPPHALKVYKWTGRNDYIAFCDTDGFSFGGGEGHYGLYLDGSLVEGTTHPCPTFDNECLAQGERKGRMVAFECVGLEVWGIGP